MQHRTLVSGLAVAALALGLAGCLTRHIDPPLSRAVADARAAAKAKADACKGAGLDEISPVDAAFAFDEAQISAAGGQRLADAAHWLACHPGVEVVIRPDADNHGSEAHLAELSQARAQAVADKLRDLGVTGVLRIIARGAPDPVATPHLVISATGRGW